MTRSVAAEFIGTALLLAVVVGSGIMGVRLAAGNDAIALLANALATAAGLAVLIATLAPVSGAHFNPLVSIVEAAHGRLPASTLGAYLVAQFAGAAAGVLLAHAMFDLNLLQTSSRVRGGAGQWISEAVATFGLLLVILAAVARGSRSIPALVGAYIGAAYWFTASTSFANPAVTLARAFTDTFAGIRGADVSGFMLAQAAGGLAAVALAHWLFPVPKRV
jgi:glycerol uptake facilitator-like aquaporin